MRDKPACHALARGHRAELDQGIPWFQWVGKEFPTVEDSRFSRALQKVLSKYFFPNPLHFMRLREKPVAPDIKTKSSPFNRARNPSDAHRVGFYKCHAETLPGKLAPGSQAGRACSQNNKW